VSDIQEPTKICRFALSADLLLKHLLTRAWNGVLAAQSPLIIAAYFCDSCSPLRSRSVEPPLCAQLTLH